MASDIQAELERLRAQIEDIIRDRVQPAMAEAHTRVEQQAETIASQVRKHPLAAVTLAALAGFVVGRAMR